MTSDGATRPIEALLRRLGGGPTPGHLGMVVADPGVGTTALVVHVALDALLREERVLHVALRDSVPRVRAWYDELLRASGRLGDDAASALVGIERHRMVLTYADRELDVANLQAQVGMLAEMAQFEPALIVIDGLDAPAFSTQRGPLAAMSSALGVPVWVTVASERPVATGDDVAFGLRLSDETGGTRLHLRDGEAFKELPWQLEVTTHLLGVAAPRAVTGPPPATECTLYSGGAAGSEQAFGEAAARYGVREVHFTFEGHKQARTEGRTVLSARELEAGDVSLVYVSRRLHRTFNEHGLVRKVLQALWHMVSRSQQVFVVGAIQDDGTVVGGTGWSVELARMWAKDLWVFDQRQDGWFHWDGQGWAAGTAELKAGQFCGTGTRYLEDNGRAAIDDLFARAFGG